MVQLTAAATLDDSRECVWSVLADLLAAVKKREPGVA